MRSYIQNLFASDDPQKIMESCQDWFSKGKKSRLEIREWVRSAYSCPLLAGNDFVPMLLLSNCCQKVSMEDEQALSYIDYAAEYLASRTNYNPLEAINSQKEDFTDKGLEIATIFLESYNHHYQAAGRDLTKLPKVSLPQPEHPSSAFLYYQNGAGQEDLEGSDIIRDDDKDDQEAKEEKPKKKGLLLFFLLLLLLCLSALAAMALQSHNGKKVSNLTSENPRQTELTGDSTEGVSISDDQTQTSNEENQIPEENKAAEKDPAQSNPVEAKPAESNPAENNPAESNPAENNPAESNPVESNPAQSNPAESNPAESSPAQESQEESKAATADVVCLDPRVIIRTGPGMNYPYVAVIDGQSNMQLVTGEIVKSQGNDGYQWRKINIDNYIDNNIEGFTALKPDKLKKGTTYYIANQYLKD